MEFRPPTRFARKLRHEHHISKSWRIAAARCRVLDDDGNPNPGEAYRIAHGATLSYASYVRLIRNGAFDAPEPRPLSHATRRALILALDKPKPLPGPSPQVLAAYDEWREHWQINHDARRRHAQHR